MIHRSLDRRLAFAVNLFLNSETEMTVRQLAAYAGLSSARFSHLFTLQVGMLPGEFLDMMKCYRTEHAVAAKILRDMGVAVAQEAGHIQPVAVAVPSAPQTRPRKICVSDLYYRS